MPYALIAAAAASFGLPAPWGRCALGAQALFYALAVADCWLPGGAALKRITSPVRTFVVLMAASLCAVSVLFLPGRYLWNETKVSVVRQAE